MNALFQKIGIVIGGVLLAISSFFGNVGHYFSPSTSPAPIESPSRASRSRVSFGDVIYQQPPLFETSLSAAMDSSQTSSTLVSAAQKSGALLSGNYCFTIDSGLTTVEFVCGVASGTSITGLIRGIGEDGVTSYASLQFPHRYGADVKVTDFPSNQRIVRIINGQGTFPNVLQYATSVTRSAITNSTSNIPTVDYVNATISSGAPAATTGVGGLVMLGTQSQLQSGTATGTYGGTDYSLVPQNKFFSPTSTATTTVPVTNTSGKLNPNFIDATSTNYGFINQTLSTTTFNGSTTFTGAATFNIPISGVLNKQVFVATTTTNWTVPTGITQIFVSGIGAGGGGAGGGAGIGGGGGGGGTGSWILRFPTSTTPGNTIAVTIGIPGIGGASQATGTAATPTTIGGFLTLNGGNPGVGGQGAGTATSTVLAGTAITGNSAAGSNGGANAGGLGGQLGNGAWICLGGAAGSSGGGNGATSTVGYGCGGGGGGANGPTNGMGAAGGPSIVIIEY